MKSLHNWLLLGCLALIAAPTLSLADDINPPPWRGDAHSYMAKFDMQQIINFPAPPTTEQIGPSAPYQLSGMLPSIDIVSNGNPLIYLIDIPNFIDPLPVKYVRVQYSWFGGTPSGNPGFPGSASTLNIIPFDSTGVGVVTPTSSSPPVQIGDPMDNIFYRYEDFEIRPNPDYEQFEIQFVDADPRWIIIDTISIPEPATLALLGVAGAVLLVVRRRR